MAVILTTRYLRRFSALLLFALFLTTQPPTAVHANTAVIYDDALAPGWQNWSWATVNLQAGSPVQSGSHSISVSYQAWQGLYLHHAGLDSGGYSKLRFYLHGGSAGGQQLQLYAVRAGDSQGPVVALPAPAAGAWAEVQVSLADLEADNRLITGFVWQDHSGGAQPVLYLDDIALVSDVSPDAPVLSAGALQPRAAPADGRTHVVVRARVSDPQGQGDVARVWLEAGGLGRGEIDLRDDGRSNDGEAGDGLYGAHFTVAPGPAGEHTLRVVAADKAGHRASLSLGAFVVLGAPGGAAPAVLPQRLAWGTNEWSESTGQDWQVNSGVPWDYVYQYITYDWYANGWGGNFVGRFANQAWNKNYIPVISVYFMLGLPPECGENAACYAQKLQNATAVSNYLAALQEAARQAQGSRPVIFHLEPDFTGFMQQLSQRPNRPAGVRPDDPTSYPVALNVPGYANNLAGFGRRLVDLIHATAPNALVAHHASMWATDGDPHNVTPAGATVMAQRTAAFLQAMGGLESDLVFVEWSDRDAGSGLRPWWDDTDHMLPRPTRAIWWENALSRAMNKRLVLWQIPAGNMALDDTCGRYRDNRVAYISHHPRELAGAGVIALLFGGGAACMTQPSSDGGFLAAQAAIAYTPPAPPTGLSGSGHGPLLYLRWHENNEPDLWGYRLVYRPAAGGTTTTLDMGRANATLLLPGAGVWQIRLAAYDAMNQLSQLSPLLTIAVTADPQRVYLPLAWRSP